MKINPTIACANLLNLKNDIDTMISVGVEIIHIDIMDGHYVPNLCFSFDTVTQLRREYPSLMLDVHLMTEDPLAYARRLLPAKPEYITFHPDTADDVENLIGYLHENGIGAGIALKPGESVEQYRSFYPFCDLVLVMAVTPGFSGQAFLERTYGTIRTLYRMREEHRWPFLIQVDGGVSQMNAPMCASCGADLVVAGALAIFGQPESLRVCCKKFVEDAKFYA